MSRSSNSEEVKSTETQATSSPDTATPYILNFIVQFLKFLVSCLAINFVLGHAGMHPHPPIPTAPPVTTVPTSKNPVIVIILFDGFRYDYLDRGLTPILRDLAQNGSSTRYMVNEFPTLSFPNIHSMSTGMHPETHGVLGNAVFDSQIRRCLYPSNEFYRYNDDIVPIWRLNENNGDGRYSGAVMWPGAHYEYQQKLPTFVIPYLNMSITWEQRIDLVISWLTHATTPANLVLAYFQEPDEQGRLFGPDSTEVNQQLKRINNIMIYYLQRLSEHGIRDLVNTFVVSDHGMVNVTREFFINLADILDPNSYLQCDDSPGIQIQPRKGFWAKVYRNLTSASAATNKFYVYKRKMIPERWHIKRNKRCADIRVETNFSYVLQTETYMKGHHGWEDNGDLSMRPPFIAQGPLIKRNYTVKPFRIIDLYPLISKMLGLQPPPWYVAPNGTLSSIKELLVNKKSSYDVPH